MLIEAALSNLTITTVFILLYAVLVTIGICARFVGYTLHRPRAGCECVVAGLALLTMAAFFDIWYEVLLWRVVWVSVVACVLHFLWFGFSEFLLAPEGYGGNYRVLSWLVGDPWDAFQVKKGVGDAATFLLLLTGNMAISYGLAVASGRLFGWGD